MTGRRTESFWVNKMFQVDLVPFSISIVFALYGAGTHLSSMKGMLAVTSETEVPTTISEALHLGVILVHSSN
jgi:hypothetical protein